MGHKNKKELHGEAMPLQAMGGKPDASPQPDILNPDQVQNDLTISEIRYRRLFESAKDGILILDAVTGKILDVNPFLISILGYSKDQFIEKAIWEIGFFKDIVANCDKFRELQEMEYVRYDDLPLETAHGKTIHVEFVSNVYTEGVQKVIQCNIRDITDRKLIEEQTRKHFIEMEKSGKVMLGMFEDQKRMEADLRSNQTRLHTLLQTIPDLIWLKDTGGVYLMCNRMFERFFGVPEADIIGKTDYHFVNREQADFFLAHDKAALLADKPTRNEEWITLADNGQKILLETIKSPMCGSNGTVVGVLGIGRDITNRKRTEEELIIAKEHAEESDRLKSAFLANMSHEIRTPMNGILGFANLLKEPDLDLDEQIKYIDIIERSSARLLNIVNDIVCISRIESGMMEVAVSEMNINNQMDDICAFFKKEVEQKGMQLYCRNSLPEKQAIVQTDKEKFYAILTNLVKNAIKFSKVGYIEIGYERKDHCFEFFVKDTGKGIRQEHQEFIFERFRQGSELLNRNYDGAGLGLSIVKAYVELLNGRIWVESKLGQGSAFYFTLPLNGMGGVKDVLDTVPAFNENTEHFKNRKILIVEDDNASKLLMAAIIGKTCNQVLIVQSGVEAVETCRRNPDLDLILMDIRMPGMDGYAATRAIRQFNREVVIIAQTAFGMAGDREKAIEAGCNEYIAKPLQKRALLTLLNSFLKI